MACDCENGRINILTVFSVIAGITSMIFLLYMWRNGVIHYALTGYRPEDKTAITPTGTPYGIIR